MSIDGFTLAAQVVNFLILAALLWRFLFRPVLAVMDRRERDLAATLKSAADAAESARRELAALESRRAEFEHERAALLDAARDAAQAEGERLCAAARAEMQEQERRWLDAFEQRKAALATELRTRLADLLCAATRAALSDLAGPALEAAVIEKFLGELERLDPRQIALMRESVVRNGRGATIRTSFEVTPEQRRRLDGALRTLLPEVSDPRFETDESGVCGVELSVGERRLAWNVDAYLERLGRDLAAADDAAAASRPAAQVGPPTLEVR